MFEALRSEGVTYTDFKPDNLGYYWQNESMVPRPIDILDNDAFSQEQDLSARRAAGILDTYVNGTPQDDGLTDEYFLTTVEAEILVADSLGIEEFRPTGDVYDDFYHQAD